MMKTVAEILKNKGNSIYSISPNATVYEALEIMADKEVGALLVLEGDQLAGIISERDYARKIILHGKSSKEIPVREIMSSKVVYVTPERSVEECMALMTNKRVRHLPVFENNRLTGIVSIGDIVKATIDEDKFLIDQLQQYITGNAYPNLDTMKRTGGTVESLTNLPPETEKNMEQKNSIENENRKKE